MTDVYKIFDSNYPCLCEIETATVIVDVRKLDERVTD